MNSKREKSTFFKKGVKLNLLNQESEISFFGNLGNSFQYSYTCFSTQKIEVFPKFFYKF